MANKSSIIANVVKTLLESGTLFPKRDSMRMQYQLPLEFDSVRWCTIVEE
jgi:hypothetical protein